MKKKLKPSQKRLFKKLVDKLTRRPVPLSTNKGYWDHCPAPGISRKDKRNKGKNFIYYDDEIYPFQIVVYDSWKGFKDGLKDKSFMYKNIYPDMYWNDEDKYWDHRKQIEKIKKREYIRKARKHKDEIKKRTSITSKD